MIITSAPGKIILFGEHAVVYGKLGIACSIDRRCFVRVSSDKKDKISIKAGDLDLNRSFTKQKLFDNHRAIDDLVKKNEFDEIRKIYKKDELIPSFFVVADILRKYGFKELKIEIHSEIPKNLGSSSAIFSAIALGTAKFLRKNLSKKKVSNFAYKGDIIAHGGTPSGIDNNIVTYGGFLRYRRSEGVKPLNIRFELPLIVVDSSEPARTGETVPFIRKFREKNPEFVNSILEKLGEISELGIEALQSKDLEKIGNLMTRYYIELKKLKISTPKLNQIINIALENGAFGAKPTGGWGGGCCLVLARSQQKSNGLMKILGKKGFKSFQSKIGVEGVKLIS